VNKHRELNMPVSRAQQRWAHTPSGEKALGAAKVAEWDKESKGKDLPERATPESSRRLEAQYQKQPTGKPFKA
jgi:hypothetical protein